MQAEGHGRGQVGSSAVPPEAKSFLRGQKWPHRGLCEGAPLEMMPSPHSVLQMWALWALFGTEPEAEGAHWLSTVGQ